MRLSRLDVTFTELSDVPTLVSDDEGPVVLRLSDADGVIALAAASAGWSGSWGVWLTANDGYGAGLIARDVKTLSALLEIDHVVVDAVEDAPAYAEAVAALLSDDEVTIHNAAAHITRAYNRPAPPRPVTVWHTDAHAQYLRHGRQVLRAYDHHGGLTHYVD